MLRCKHLIDDLCPYCGETETTDYILRCKNNDMNKIFEEKMKVIEQWLQQTTSKLMTKGIKVVLTAFRNESSLNLTGCQDPMVGATATQQFDLGQ